MKNYGRRGIDDTRRKGALVGTNNIVSPWIVIIRPEETVPGHN